MSNHGSVVSICHRIIPLPCIKQVVLAFCKQNKRLANSSFPFQLWTPYQGIAKISSIRVKCVTDHIGFGFCFFLRYPVFCKRTEIQSVFSYRHQDFLQEAMTVIQMKSIFYWKDHWIGNFPDLFTDYRVLFVPSPSGITSDLPRIICSHKRFSFKKLSLLSLCNKFLYLPVHFIDYLLNSGVFHFF